MSLMDTIESFFLKSAWIDTIPEAIAAIVSGPAGCATPSPPQPSSMQNRVVVGKSACASSGADPTYLLDRACYDAYVHVCSAPDDYAHLCGSERKRYHAFLSQGWCIGEMREYECGKQVFASVPAGMISCPNPE